MDIKDKIVFFQHRGCKQKVYSEVQNNTQYDCEVTVTIDSYTASPRVKVVLIKPDFHLNSHCLGFEVNKAVVNGKVVNVEEYYLKRDDYNKYTKQKNAEQCCIIS